LLILPGVGKKKLSGNIMNLEKLSEDVIQLCLKDGVYIKQQLELLKAKDIELKDDHNFVTYVDRTSEEMLVEALSRLTPGCGFIAEESEYGPSEAALKWIIDPLDGTTNFVHGIPLFAISIALMEGDNVILGVVHEVNRSESFYSWKGGKAYVNGKEIRVSSAKTLKDSLLVTGFPYIRDYILDQYMELFKEYIRRTQDLRRLGSAATDLAYVAAGRFEGFYEISLNAWDVAAGSFLVQQAGGTVTDFKGGDDYIFGGSLVSSNGFVHEEMLEVVKKFYKNTTFKK
jgi:myo-inositol-1(or 4)-monophosphatase